MMEVKQNTPVDLNDLLTSGKNSGTDEVDDAVMTDLTENSHKLECDLITTTKDKPTSIAEVENGDDVMDSLIQDDDDEEEDEEEDDVVADIDVPAELEDALLAEDDVLPKLISNKNVGGPTATDDDILADKVETSNSTTSSINVRDPGDDLDTLLSKINDIVEDCIDNESTVNTEIEEEDEVEEDKKIESKECNNENKTVLLDESVIFMGVTNNGDESKLEEIQDEMSDETQNYLENKTCNDTIEENLTKVEETKNSDIPEDVEMSELITNNFVQDLNNGNVEEDNTEEDNIDKEIEEGDQMDKDKVEEENIVEDKTEEDKIVDETADKEKIEEDKEEEEEIGENKEKEKQVEKELVDNKMKDDKEELITAEEDKEELITAEEDKEELITAEEDKEKLITAEEDKEKLITAEEDKKGIITAEDKTEEHNLDKVVIEKDKVDEEKEVTIKDYNELTESDNKLQDTPKEILNIPEMENKKENDINSQIEKVSETNHQITATENHAEKTEVINTEAVQDNEITSNSDENLEVKKSTEKTELSLETTTDNKQEEEEESTEIVKKQDSPIKDNEVVPSISSESKETLEEVETPSTKETNSSEKVENEDSDDDIVFYVDKPPETEKSKETENIAEKPKEAKEIVTETTEENKKEDKEPAKKSTEDNDDVVLLLDDDDEDMNQTKTVEEKQKDFTTDKKSEENQETKSKTDETVDKTKEELKTSNIDVDNSDNARDDFVTEKPSKEKASKDDTEETPEETNSNCSSSSNLLQEAKSTENTVDEPITEEAENDEEEDDGDVELIESESKEADISEKGEDSELAPPAKRLRLSEDSQVSTKSEESNKEQKEIDSADSTTTPINTKNKIESEKDEKITAESTSSSSSLKRSHDVIELELDDKSNDSKTSTAEESINKKPRTEESASGEKSEEKDKDDEVIEIDQDLKEKDDLKVDIKEDIKAVPSFKPIPLYPPPKLEVLKSEESISLEFLKKFRKSFDKMTKQDLEELVLQKVVEAIVHRSEFSEMRELIEKQEKLITAHRTKISELSKQFRDLEMVHNRVVKDIEQRNSQFIMPVKITRAVGLQVYIPNKKGGADAGGSSASSTPSVPSSPQRPVSTQSTSSTPPQRPFLASQAESRSSGSNTASAGNVVNVRRGCVQKITPTRPVPGANNASTSTGPTANASTAYRNTTNQAMSQPRILNKNASTTASASNMQQRARYISANQDNQRMQTQQQPQQISRPPVVSQRVSINAATQQKTSPNVAASAAAAAAQRRSDPMPQPAAATSSTSSIVDNYMNTLTHLTGGNTAVSITPAKPKEKAVIDLTDEDEAPPPPPPIQNAQPAAVPVTQVPRRSLPVQNNNNSQIQYGRQAPPLTRIPPVNQMANNKNRQINTMQAQKNNNSFTSLSTPVGTSITRINVPSNTAPVQRVKYSHPAPLPATPPQAFNPSWKLPPPRPTIRISNLDNGIVISWTMEESMDRHAECVSYQIYAYQETSGPPMVDSWRHVGDVKAMLLPMAVTLTQFQEGQRYYFAVRAVDCHQRFGPFSLPKTWS